MGREPAWSDSLWYHWRLLVVSAYIIIQLLVLSFNNAIWLLFSTHNHIKSASELSAGCDYSLFKAGIKPMWEDPRNNNGGRWLISLDKKQRSSELDNYWLEVVSCISCSAHTFSLNHIFIMSQDTVSDWWGIWGIQRRHLWSCGQHSAKGRQTKCLDSRLH